MTPRHTHVLLFYGGFVALSVLLALARRWLRPGAGRPSVWKKYPTYILLNLIFLAAAWLPGAWHGLALLLAIIGAGASWEICRGLGLGGVERAGLPAATACLTMAAELLGPAALLPIWIGALLALVAAGALIGEGCHLGRRMIAVAGGGVYLPLCLAALIWLWHMDGGGFVAVFFYMVIVGNDAFAQITGQLLGRRLLAPQISPGKTVAGALGGAICAAAVGAALSSTIGWPAGTGAAAGAAIGVAGQIGDLVESRWKRALGLKDFSGLLGAQGGVLDRFDALIFAAPVFYLLVSHL
jgi:phosphatidate cytidylyltransferase